MTKRNDPAVVVPYRLTPGQAEVRVRSLANDSGKVILGNHAKERCLERDFVREDVLRLLRHGMVKDQPELTEYKEWKCKVVGRIRGSREAGVVTVMLHNGCLFVKTVEWEDWSHG